MYVLLTILIVIASVLLILLVLVQNSKGGGLSAGFSSTNQIMGVRKTTDFLEKATWGLVAFVVVLSVATVAFNNKKDAETLATYLIASHECCQLWWPVVGLGWSWVTVVLIISLI